MDLPAPVSPTSATDWPAGISKETPRSASLTVWGYRNTTSSNAMSPTSSPGTTGSDGGGTDDSSDSSSSMRSSDTRACWYESNVWLSCWMGSKNRSTYRRNAISVPVCSAPSESRTLPTPSTSAAASSESISTNGKYIATSLWAPSRASR